MVNPRSSIIESPAQVSRLIEKALRLYPADKLWLNPDCGFGNIFKPACQHTRSSGS